MSYQVRSNGPYGNKAHFKTPRQMVRNCIGRGNIGTRDLLPLNGFSDQLLVNIEKIGTFNNNRKSVDGGVSFDDYNFNEEKNITEQERSTKIGNSRSGGLNSNPSRANFKLQEELTDKPMLSPKRLVIDYSPEHNEN